MADPQDSKNKQNIDASTRERVLNEVAGDLSWAGNTLPSNSDPSETGIQGYKAARSSESGSGMVVAEFEGEQYVLLEQPKKRDGSAHEHWELPAGYRELHAEAELGGEKAPEGTNMRPLDPKDVSQVLQAKRRQIFADALNAGVPELEALEAVKAFENSEKEVESYLLEQGFDWDTKLDATLAGAFTREVREETGIDLSDLPLEHVASNGTLNISSGRNMRNNHTDHMFLADLGAVEALPEITLQEEEIAQAKWVKVSDVKLQKVGSYSVEGGMPMDFGQAMEMKLALNKHNEEKAQQKQRDQAEVSAMIPGEQSPSFVGSIPVLGSLAKASGFITR